MEFPENFSEWLNEHEAILIAVQNGNAEEVENTVRMHALNYGAYLEKLFDGGAYV